MGSHLQLCRQVVAPPLQPPQVDQQPLAQGAQRAALDLREGRGRRQAPVLRVVLVRVQRVAALVRLRAWRAV